MLVNRPKVCGVKASEKEAFDFGFTCGYQGKDTCELEYTTSELVNAWGEGWKAGKEKRLGEIERKGVAREWREHYWLMERRG
jgi:hypothetical protein